MKVSELEFQQKSQGDTDTLFFVHTELGRITVLDRMTGYSYGIRDIETGYRDKDGKFCLASGGFDIRRFPGLSIEEAVELIKKESDTVRWKE